MSIRLVTIIVAGVVLAFQWPLFQAWRAAAKLTEFYREMSSARFGNARESIDEAIRLWPSNARYYTWRAYCTSQSFLPQCPRKARSGGTGTFDRNAIEDAIQDYRRSLDLNPRDAVAHHNLAWLEHVMGNDSEAERDWRRAIELDPATAVFYLSYGMFLEEAGKLDEAWAQYEMAIALTPSILDSPFFVRFRSRSPQGSDSTVSHSIAALEGRIAGGRDPILEARLGKLYLYIGKLDRAAELLNDAGQQLPNLPLVWVNLGELQAKQGHLQQAVDCYKKAIVLDAALSDPYERMGEIKFQNGERREAADDFKLAVQRWQRATPITAAHNNRLYTGPRQLIDDLLPTTLVWYTTPCAASEAWQGLAQLFPQNQDFDRRSRACEQLPSPHEFRDF